MTGYINIEAVYIVGVLALMIGVIIGLAFVLATSDKQKKTARKEPSIKITSPRRQRKQSLNRATLRARMMLATGAIDVPRR
ncbi:MAG: hypothetical protein C0622_05185 [Desulfuromonas sp.]|nr:MAG: hypothetical protein C0622_05185 [Desulfuromonas sp.]